MAVKKFLTMTKAVEYAATIADEWQLDDGETADTERLLEIADFSDGEGGLNEEDEEDFDPETSNSYIIVDETGSLGFFFRKGNRNELYAKSTHLLSAASDGPIFDNDIEEPPKFCSGCGAPVNPGQNFCTYCGTKLK